MLKKAQMEEPHIVMEYRRNGCLIQIADNDYRNLTPEQIQRNIQNVNVVVSRILRNAVAEGRMKP